MVTWLLRLIPTHRLLAALLARKDFCGIVVSWHPSGDSGRWTWEVRRLETREDVFGVLEGVLQQVAVSVPSSEPHRG